MSQCRQCGSCCCHLPGFFAPHSEAVKKLALYLQEDEAAVKNYLVRDYRSPFGEKVWFWSPAMVDKEGKKLIAADIENYPLEAERAGREGGHCIFFDPETRLCRIHPVKPLGCKIYDCQSSENNTGRMYFQYFKGEGEVRRVNQAEWAELWDFYCPKCGEDEAAYTGEIKSEDKDYHKVVCAHCGYWFWVY
ncbi:MAG: YkgJ family cysteine cluster protein [bacterium]